MEKPLQVALCSVSLLDSHVPLIHFYLHYSVGESQLPLASWSPAASKAVFLQLDNFEMWELHLPEFPARLPRVV